MDDDELQRLLIRSSTGGRHATLKMVVDLLREKAGAAFAESKDHDALLIRSLSSEFEELRVKASQDLTRLNAQTREK